MKRHGRNGNVWLGVCALGAMCAGPALAQVRAGGEAKAVEPKTVEIRDVEGLGMRGKVKTPEYTSNQSSGRVPPRDWGRVLVYFDTAPEWIDELTFQYHVLLYKEEKGKAMYTLFNGSVAYRDIARGRRHISLMLLQPTTLLRYGEIAGAAVEVFQAGKSVDLRSEQARGVPKDKEWWNSPNLVARDGYLLNRLQTPFAFISYDDYETIK